jgi:large subunit ribosomal protein L4
MELAVFNSEGNKTSKKVTLDDSVFGIEPNDHAIYLDVKRFMAANRQGNSKTKERAEIAGSTRKIKKQKGTGTARAGSIKSPLFRGGGNIFGPRPRNYDMKVNVKVKRLARKSALSYKAQSEGITLLENLEMSGVRTREYAQLMSNLKLNDKKTLLVIPADNKNVYLSSRNLQGHSVCVADKLNTYDIMNCNNLIFVDGAHEIIEKILKN